MNFFEKLKEYEGMTPGLLRIKGFLSVFENPQDKIKVVHIAGTNGKGSCAAFIAEILKVSGYKVGLYTSPDLVDIKERIKINGRNIEQNVFEKYLQKYLKKALDCKLSYFEYLTALSFIYFEKQKVDIAIIETGLGGRFDATNIIKNPLICIITSISKDHQEILGNTVEKIAFEKSGIIKKSSSVVCGKLPKKASDVIRNKSKSNIVRFYQKDFKALNVNMSLNGQRFDYISKSLHLKNLREKLLGKHQIINACVAICAVQFLLKNGFVKINSRNIRNGLENTFWQARFEIKKVKINNKSLTIVIDGAHNEEGLKAFVDTYKQLGFAKSKKVFIFASMKEKNYKLMVKKIAPFAKKVVLPKINNNRSVSSNILKEEFLKFVVPNNIYTVNSVMDALSIVSDHKIIICVGSLYLAGEILANIK
ncbi:MAG: bifunctional folylpolyglutamate synthase/dihydrofolate synthase [Endomicrobium sp.]|jgi:dihydrofolate synthase/folylpolyglutamate synthase|nr:bifunctional folylpolyglutamate synthase/dihydrofolate synthase [Endomicrobium sp.]